MVLSSAAASTQTTILPTARTTLSMAVFKAVPDAFGKIHRRYLTPTASTLTMGGVAIVLYVVMNYVSNGNSVIADSVSALGVVDRLLLRADGVLLLLVLPQDPAARAPARCGYAASFLWSAASSCGSPCSGPSGTTGTRSTVTATSPSPVPTRSSVASSPSIVGTVILGVVLMYLLAGVSSRPSSGAKSSTVTRRPGCRRISACPSACSESRRSPTPRPRQDRAHQVRIGAPARHRFH